MGVDAYKGNLFQLIIFQIWLGTRLSLLWYKIVVFFYLYSIFWLVQLSYNKVLRRQSSVWIVCASYVESSCLYFSTKGCLLCLSTGKKELMPMEDFTMLTTWHAQHNGSDQRCKFNTALWRVEPTMKWYSYPKFPSNLSAILSSWLFSWWLPLRWSIHVQTTWTTCLSFWYKLAMGFLSLWFLCYMCDLSSWCLIIYYLMQLVHYTLVTLKIQMTWLEIQIFFFVLEFYRGIYINVPLWYTNSDFVQFSDFFQDQFWFFVTQSVITS